MSEPLKTEKGQSILEWRGVSFKVPDPEAKKAVGKHPMKHILSPMNGSAKGGRMLAIMGASGAGKTSLLNFLSGRTQAKDRKFTKGTLLLNNQVMNGAQMQSSVAYVQQEDALMKTDTPAEAINFSANLRKGGCPSSSQVSDKFTNRKEGVRRRVKYVTKQLGLEDCKDTRIGDVRLKGISGGEKRRVSIGVEIVSDPCIVFLDEPTSGLDSITALSVVSTMRKLAQSDKIVIATIHQPNSEIFHLFDDLLLLTKGKVAYCGPLKDAQQHFEECGFPCPTNYNPADHYLKVLHTPDEQAIQKVLDLQKIRSSKIDPVVKPPHEILKLPSRTGANICTQLKYLMIREARSYWRDPASTIAQVAIAVFMGLFLGSINSGAGSSDQPVADVKGSLFLPIIQSFFMGLNGSLLRGIQGRTLFDREHMAGTYGIFAYLFATVIVSIPVNLLCSAILMSLLHLFIGWQGQIMLIWISMFTIQMIGVAWGLTIGFATGDVNIAQSFSPAVIVPQIYLAGFYRSTENMGVWMRWLQWMCGLMYGYKSMLILEFGDEKNHFEHELQEQTDTTSQHMLEFKAFAAKINLPEHYAKEVEAHLASKTQAQRSHMNNKIRDEFFTHNGISRDDPHQDLLFYMLVPLGLFAALCVFAMIALKISALRR